MDYHINEMDDNSGDKNYFDTIIRNTNINDNNYLNVSINIYRNLKQNESTISQNYTNFLNEKENFQFYIPLSFFRLTDMSCMFKECNSLISLEDISKWDTYKINDMNNMFFECKSSIKLPELYILNKNKSNIIFELTYKKNNKGKTKILDDKFIERNRNRCSIIYNSCEFELKESLEDIDHNPKDI